VNKLEWKEQIRKTRWVKGKKLGKRELGQVAQGMLILGQLGALNQPQHDSRRDDPIKRLMRGIGK